MSTEDESVDTVLGLALQEHVGTAAVARWLARAPPARAPWHRVAGRLRLLTPFLQMAGGETVARMRKRVLDNLTTTFASSYKSKVDLEGMLTKEAILDYRQMKSGEKYLVMPNG